MTRWPRNAHHWRPQPGPAIIHMASGHFEFSIASRLRDAMQSCQYASKMLIHGALASTVPRRCIGRVDLAFASR